MKLKLTFEANLTADLFVIFGDMRENTVAAVVGTWDYKNDGGYVYVFNEDMTGNYSTAGDFTYTDD